MFKVGDKVLVIDGTANTNMPGDEGVVLEIDQSDNTLRVYVAERINAGNWMYPNQIINLSVASHSLIEYL
jgi:ribosomal protein L24